LNAVLENDRQHIGGQVAIAAMKINDVANKLLPPFATDWPE